MSHEPSALALPSQSLKVGLYTYHLNEKGWTVQKSNGGTVCRKDLVSHSQFETLLRAIAENAKSFAP